MQKNKSTHHSKHVPEFTGTRFVVQLLFTLLLLFSIESSWIFAGNVPPGEVVKAETGGKSPAGPPVNNEQSKKEEALTRDFISKAANGQQVDSYCDTIIIFPGLWDRVKSGLAPNIKGKPVICTVPDQAPGKTRYLLGQGFLKETTAQFFKSKNVVDFFKKMSTGIIRPATQQERNIHYYYNCWEIDGKPLTVVQSGADIMLLEFGDDKIFVIDLISNYRPGMGTTNIEDYIKK